MSKNNNWKADEMEMAINVKAMRCGWIFLIASLTIWFIIEFITNGDIPTVPFVLECVSSLIFFSVKLYLTKRLTHPEGDDNEE